MLNNTFFTTFDMEHLWMFDHIWSYGPEKRCIQIKKTSESVSRDPFPSKTSKSLQKRRPTDFQHRKSFFFNEGKTNI